MSIPVFYDRYKGKWPDIIGVLCEINRIALKHGLGELFLNGNNIPGNFGGCDECRQVSTYQISARSKVIKSPKSPMYIEIEKGYNCQLDGGGNPNYFVNFRIQTELLNIRFADFMEFFDECFFTLTGNYYNLVLLQGFGPRTYINLVYVPLERQGLVAGRAGIVNHNPLVWLALTIHDNLSLHKFYIEGIPASIWNQLSDVERFLLENESDKTPLDSNINDLLEKIMKHLAGEAYKK